MYLGHGRSEHFASPEGAVFDRPRTYGLPEHLPFGHWALGGEWTIGRAPVVLEQPGGSIAFRFHAREARTSSCRRRRRSRSLPRAPRR